MSDMNVCILCGDTAAQGLTYCTQPRCYEKALARLRVQLASAEGLRDKYAQETMDLRAKLREAEAKEAPPPARTSDIKDTPPAPAPIEWSKDNIAFIDGFRVTSDRDGVQWEVAIYCCLRCCTKELSLLGMDRDLLARELVAQHVAARAEQP